MYLQHFGLNEFPFGITPDVSFIYSGDSHQEALNTLLIGLNSGEGFIKITGEVGTGKTLLLRRFLATRHENQVVAYLPNPMLESQVLLMALAEELGLAYDASQSAFHLIKDINRHLLDMAAQGKTVVVCIDEAQCMPIETLETLRLLSNLETEKRKLLQVVMFGQPELDAHLANPAVRQLRQRIVMHYRLSGLRAAETGYYLTHRLRIAGHRDGDIFAPGAVRLLHRLSGGIPRLLNVLTHKALLLAYGEGKSRVNRSHVVKSAHDTPGALTRRWWLHWLPGFGRDSRTS